MNLHSIDQKHHIAFVALLSLMLGISNPALAQESAKTSLTNGYSPNNTHIKLSAVNSSSPYTRKTQETSHPNIVNADGNHPSHWYISGTGKSDTNNNIAFPVSIWHLH